MGQHSNKGSRIVPVVPVSLPPIQILPLPLALPQPHCTALLHCTAALLPALQQW